MIKKKSNLGKKSAKFKLANSARSNLVLEYKAQFESKRAANPREGLNLARDWCHVVKCDVTGDMAADVASRRWHYCTSLLGLQSLVVMLAPMPHELELHSISW